MTPPNPVVTVDDEGTVTGNTYDKYGSTNPAVKRLMAHFHSTLSELFARADPEEPAFGPVLDAFYGGEPDPATEEILGS